jgi:hypothetical protein
VRRNIWRCWLGVTLLAGGLCGCERATVSHTYPPDPLLISKRPLESSPEAATTQLVSTDPAAPALPATALASAPRDRLSVLRDSVAPEPPLAPAPLEKPVLAQPVSNRSQRAAPGPQEENGSGPPAIRAKGATDLPAVASAPPRVQGPYGHAPDHSWLQGILDKHYQGHWALRYCDHATEDEWGGKVRLEKDGRLDQFKDGDIILVEGEVIPDVRGNRGNWHHYPEYRIRNIQLIEHRQSGG